MKDSRCYNIVHISSFVNALELDTLYYVKSSEEDDYIDIYSSSRFTLENLVARLPYTREEWHDFLTRHNCKPEGDYYDEPFARCRGERFIHQEFEDSINFDISAGIDINCNGYLDLLRINH